MDRMLTAETLGIQLMSATLKRSCAIADNDMIARSQSCNIAWHGAVIRL